MKTCAPILLKTCKTKRAACLATTIPPPPQSCTRMNTLLQPRATALVWSFCFALLGLSSCSPKLSETGKASYYADSFRGKPTASGQPYRPGKLTAAHKTLPFGTRVKVHNLQTGKTVKVTITDRGPFVKGRIIDLSRKAAKKIGLLRAGIAEVELKYKKPAR